MGHDGTLNVDVAVVGAGLAGLTAATVAARAGASVAVFDIRSPGGRARSDQRDGYVLNQGPHALYKAGAGAGVLKRLGVPLRGAPPHSAVAGYRQAAGTMAVLPTSASSLLRSPLVDVRGKLRLGWVLKALPKLAAADLAAMSAAAWIDSLKLTSRAAAIVSALTRVATYAGDLRVISADAAVRQLQLALEEGVCTSMAVGRLSSMRS